MNDQYDADRAALSGASSFVLQGGQLDYAVCRSLFCCVLVPLQKVQRSEVWRVVLATHAEIAVLMLVTTVSTLSGK